MTTRAPHADEITREHVAQAIIQLMRGQGGDGQVDQALAGTLAGQVLADVKKLFVGKSPTLLGSDPAFRSLVTTHLSTATPIDQAAERRAIAERANVTSADFAAATRGQDRHAAHGRFSAIITGDIVERGRETLPNGQAANGNLTFEQARNMAAARAMASELGMPWAANHPDLLKLGPAAIKAIAETNLRETGYKALRNGAYYEAPDIVAFAKHSKLRGFDAEKAAKSTEALVQALPPAEQKSTSEVLRRFDHAAAAYYANPNDAAARERFEAAGKAQKQRMEEIAQRSQADRARVQRLEDDKRVEQRFRATTVGNEHAATVKEQRAEVKDKKAEEVDAANFGDLDGPPPAAPKKDATVPPAAPAATATGSPPAKAPPPAKPPAPK